MTQAGSGNSSSCDEGQDRSPSPARRRTYREANRALISRREWLKDIRGRLAYLREHHPGGEYAIYGWEGLQQWCAQMGIRDRYGKVPSRETLRRWRDRGWLLMMTASRGTRFGKLWTTNYTVVAGITGMTNLKRASPKVPALAMQELCVKKP